MQTHVRFTPNSGHSLAAPLRPNKGVNVLASEYVKKYEQLLAQDIAVIPGCAAPELIVKRAPEFAPSISVQTLKTGAGSNYINTSRGAKIHAKAVHTRLPRDPTCAARVQRHG